MQQIVNKEFNFAPFFLSTALIFFAVAKAMPVKLALYKEKNEAKYTTHYLQIAALVQQIVNKEFNFAPFFLSTALIFFAVATAMPVKLALYKEKNEAKYTTHYLQIAALDTGFKLSLVFPFQMLFDL